MARYAAETKRPIRKISAEAMDLLKRYHWPGNVRGVVFTGDNVFYKCRTWLQECDPWEWLAALDAIAALDVETIVPGHGDPCGKEYLKEQAQIVENWVGLVERFVDRGLSADEALKEPIAVTKQDPYPIGQRLFVHDERLTGLIVRNLHKRILDKKQARA